MKNSFIILAIVIVILVGWLLMRSDSETNITTQKNIEMGDVIFKTSMGNVTIDLFEENTPKTVENFLTLARDGFYDGTRFHRVIEGFMVQGGDPLSKDLTKEALWGTGGPGYKFADEIVPELSNITGTLSMANAGPDTNGSQFFINVGDNTFLDGKHTVFGKVLEGMDVVLAISQVSTKEKGITDRPVEPIILEQIIVNY